MGVGGVAGTGRRGGVGWSGEGEVWGKEGRGRCGCGCGCGGVGWGGVEWRRGERGRCGGRREERRREGVWVGGGGWGHDCEPSITGMLIQSDEGEAVPANPTLWLYPVTKREPSHNDFLIDSGAATSVCLQSLTAWEENPSDPRSSHNLQHGWTCTVDVQALGLLEFFMKVRTNMSSIGFFGYWTFPHVFLRAPF